ncbi:MAG: hypothetical protein COT17_07065 [Elusimicrobia bacterium CG08_land_8_20_14_0_20_51_18]|nr:MAG: hypothetical protein COT17_07065 [Elusimicrobia bacterium CG08_land_8_20_14_0_20_51_18]
MINLFFTKKCPKGRPPSPDGNDGAPVNRFGFGAGHGTIRVSLLLLLTFMSGFFSATDAKEFKKLRTQRLSPLSDTLLRESAREPGQKQLKAFNAFNLKNSKNKKWKIRFNSMTGYPESLTGDSTLKYKGTPEEIFFRFLDENAELTGVDKKGLRPSRKKSFLGVTHLNYQQHYKDLPVEFSYVRMHINGSGEISGYQAKHYPDIDLETNPGVNLSFAEAAVRADLGYFTLNSGELVVFPDPVSGKYYLAWKIKGRGGSGEKAGLWIYYVDASTGKILFNYDDLRYACVSPNNVTTGTVNGMVYDISPIPTGNSDIHPDQWLVKKKKPISDQYVWVGDYQNKDATDSNGEYCSNINGKVFTAIQGPYFSVSNFKAPSSYFTNGTPLWQSASTLVSSPNPYDNSREYVYNVNISNNWSGVGRAFAFAAPYFSTFRVGSMDNCGGTLDGDLLHIQDPAGNKLSSYVGNRTNFLGGYVTNPDYGILLKTDATGVYSGFTVNISSYMLMTAAPFSKNNATGSMLWSTHTYLTDGNGGEINSFYHLNKARNFFESMNIDPNSVTKPINVDKQVPVMAHVFGDVVVPDYCSDPNSLYNAFYDMENDMIMLGDGPMDAYSQYRDFGLDGTIVRHEYVHLAANRIYPIINFGEFGAISEAMADYFALASFWKDGLDINILGNFIGSGEGASRDISASVRIMPASWVGEVHDDSLILSPALYKLRKNPTYDLGTFTTGAFNGLHRADILAFAALFYFPDNFTNYLDAMIDACKQIENMYTGQCNTSLQGQIVSAFSAHGIVSSGYAAADIHEPNNGPEWATDLSNLDDVYAYIDYQGDEDYYSIPLGAGVAHFKLDLPASSMNFLYHAYSMFLFDQHRNYITEAVPTIYNTYTGYCPDAGECRTEASSVDLYYNVTSAGRYYLAVTAGPNVYYGNSPDYDASKTYKLTRVTDMKGSMSARLSLASFDADELSFEVKYPKFAYQTHPTSSSWSTDPWDQSEIKFEYARLLDHNMNPLYDTETNDSAGYMSFVSGSLAAATDHTGNPVITGKVKLKSGFSARYPGIGTVYLQVMGSNHMLNIVKPNNIFSLGVSNAVNLSADKNNFVTYNNIITSANARTIMKYEVKNAGNLSIKVYTSSGALVKTVFSGQVAAGKGSFDWDGTTDGGSKAASGIYFVKAGGPGLDKVDKVAIVR